MAVINPLKLYEELSTALDDKAARLVASAIGQVYEELANSVTKDDFRELRAAVQELTAAQTRTETRLAELVGRVDELAAAQTRTETRLAELVGRVDELAAAQTRTETRLAELVGRVDELAAAQTRTETRLAELVGRVDELAAAQTRTETRLAELVGRVDELAAAQTRTETRLAELVGRVDELAAAQTRTETRLAELAAAQLHSERAIDRLTKGLDDLRKQVGGLSAAVGYGLENSIFPFVRSFARKEYGIEVGVVERRNIEYSDGRFDEINVYAEGLLDGHPVLVIGEAKAQPGKSDLSRFTELATRVERETAKKVYPFLVGHSISPALASYAREKFPEVKLVNSSVIELRYARQIVVE